MTKLEVVFNQVVRDVQVLTAKTYDEKMKLGISNQDYPAEKAEASVRIIKATLKAEIAESLLLDNKFLFHSAASDRYVKLIEAEIGKIRIAG